MDVDRLYASLAYINACEASYALERLEPATTLATKSGRTCAPAMITVVGCRALLEIWPRSVNNERSF